MSDDDVRFIDLSQIAPDSDVPAPKPRMLWKDALTNLTPRHSILVPCVGAAEKARVATNCRSTIGNHQSLNKRLYRIAQVAQGVRIWRIR